jgi:hypothetical protein
MRTIAEQNMLLRMPAELPVGLRLTTREFREGWTFVSGDASRLEKKIRTRGWNFIKVGDGASKSGVGETSQEAIASALKLALRRMSAHFNAAEVERIELTHYPWFFLARVKIYPYRIQEGAVVPMPDEPELPAIASRQKRLPLNAAAHDPEFGSAMPGLKQMLVLSRRPQGELSPPSFD